MILGEAYLNSTHFIGDNHSFSFVLIRVIENLPTVQSSSIQLKTDATDDNNHTRQKSSPPIDTYQWILARTDNLHRWANSSLDKGTQYSHPPLGIL